MRWLAGQETTAVYITTITQAEMLYGVEVLPAGRRRSRLSAELSRVFSEDFRGRILPFDEESARAFATIVATRRAAGRPISQSNAMIASVARSHGAAVATRNAGDLQNYGVRVVNPWAADQPE